MCVRNGSGVKKTRKYDLIVWKVMRKERKIGNLGFEKEIITPFRRVTESDMLTFPAGLWDRGQGYGCFPTKELAEEYMSCLTVFSHRLDELVVKSYRIPAGTPYEYGEIGKSFWGAGMWAMRAYRLIED